jgi:hypothetical protein
MGMWVAVTGSLMMGFCLGALYTSLAHIAQRADAEAQVVAGIARPAGPAK